MACRRLPEEKTKSKYRTERKNRDAFRDLLRQHGDEGKITSNTFWGDYAEKARSYLLSVPGSLLHVPQYSKVAKRNRKKFVELLQKSREVTAKTSYEKAAKLLGSSPAWEAMDDATRRQCFDIFVDQLKIQAGTKEDEEDEDAKKKKKEGKTTKKRKQEEEEAEEPPKKTKKKKEEPSKDEEEATKKKAKKK
eukprot:Skav208215  [mRNA]  locus=scaffold3686:16063:20211:- [translate_table: standard]